MSSRRVIVIGCGAAGFFAAITCAEASAGTEVIILERGVRFLDKVRISGGGRCNVTHACFETREFATRYPRGEQELLAPLQKFSASDTVAWFAARGVKLKTESDGRMFPVTDLSQTIVDCLMNAARAAGVKLRLNAGVECVRKRAGGGFEVWPAGGTNPHPGPLHFGKGEGESSAGEMLCCDWLLLATGGCRAAIGGQLAVSLGHTLEPPVPSLFTFHVSTPWLRELAGISVAEVEAGVGQTPKDPNTQIPKRPALRGRGPLLITHWGVSGPVILRLSAWGARELHEVSYDFPLLVNWLPHLSAEKISGELDARRRAQPAKLIVNVPLSPLPARLWEQLVGAAGIARETRWSDLSRAQQHQLTQQLTRTELPVTGKSLNKDEFVTCGGVRLREVNFKTMESRVCPGLFLAGELLDVDGITGGFNFQAAWTTGWLAGQALAEEE
ncbi:MAG: NAD(P)/FAD-dependent oxidoreductase [Pedosphaera sp.]|nr:NAD(P)/FAD-dependent oxidoreductase [Pedosphaera sp.]